MLTKNDLVVLDKNRNKILKRSLSASKMNYVNIDLILVRIQNTFIRGIKNCNF